MADVKKNRRKGNDFLAKFISNGALVGWITISLTLIVFHFARPDKLGDRQWKVGGNMTWDKDIAQYILYLCFAGLLISLTTLFANVLRNRRARDYIHINLIILALVSIAGITLFTISF